MKKLAFVLSLLPILTSAQDNNNIKLGYNTLNNITIFGNKKPHTFIDTIEVIVLLHHLDDFEPSQFVTTRRVFMERKGELMEYNTAKGNTLAYSPGWMKLPTETKIFYKTIHTTLKIGEFIDKEDIYEKVEIVIPKNKILQIYHINEDD